MARYVWRNCLFSVRAIILFVLLFVYLSVPSASLAYEGFIDDAVPHAQAAQRETGVPTSVTIAQAIIESEWGDKHIGDANNYFGIKWSRNADGTLYYGEIAIGCVEVETKEWDGTKYITVLANFRKYKNMTDSFVDHGRFFIENPRYGTAMQYTDDPDQFAREIHKAGYATSPTYSDNLINLMETYNLYQYDVDGQVELPVLPDSEELAQDIQEKIETWLLEQQEKLQDRIDQWLEEKKEEIKREIEIAVTEWLEQQQCYGSSVLILLVVALFSRRFLKHNI